MSQTAVQGRSRDSDSSDALCLFGTPFARPVHLRADSWGHSLTPEGLQRGESENEVSETAVVVAEDALYHAH
jgi:hypothetical protein